MRAVLCLMLCFFAMANGNYDDDDDMRALNMTDPTLTFEQISEIVRNPIYRESAPSRLLSAPPIESYAPLSSGSQNAKLEHISKIPKVRVPSLELEPPLESSEDVYERHAQFVPPTLLPTFKPDTNKQNHIPFPSQQSAKYTPLNEPLSSEITYMETTPTAVHLSQESEIPYLDIQKQRNNYPPVPSKNLEAPLFEPYYPQYSDEDYVNPITSQQKPPPYRGIKNMFVPIITENIEPPKYLPSKPLQNPTKTYPKKYNSRYNDFKKKKLQKEKPVVELTNEDGSDEVKYFKRQKPIKIVVDPSTARTRNDQGLEPYFHNQALEKQRQMHEESQIRKREKLYNEALQKQHFLDESVAKTFGANQEPVPSESEINSFHDGGEASFAAPVNHPSLVGGVSDASHGVGGERTEFRMHGQHGPHSYKFGYDTGEGKNRQFRFEERDNDGYVKGHYGYYDRHGKLQVVNYDAHPDHGFHAEGPFGKV